MLVAIYRLSATVVKRSEGRSAVAAAAYRSGTRLEDDRVGQVFDYRRRRGVTHREIMAPRHAPAGMKNRARLWNMVERQEKRKDAQLCREIQLALPHELGHGQRVDLVRQFIGEEFVSLGMVADVALHAPGRKADDRNHHAHVLLTLRGIEGDGFGNKCREWNDEVLLLHWRATWATHVNAMLEREGINARIDHRTLLAQKAEPVQLAPPAEVVSQELEPVEIPDDATTAPILCVLRGDAPSCFGAVPCPVINGTGVGAAPVPQKDEPLPTASTAVSLMRLFKRSAFVIGSRHLWRSAARLKVGLAQMMPRRLWRGCRHEARRLIL